MTIPIISEYTDDNPKQKEEYGAPAAPVVDSYGSPQASPLNRSSSSPSLSPSSSSSSSFNDNDNTTSSPHH